MVTKIMVYHNFGKRYTVKRYTVIQKLRNSIYRSTGILNTSTIFSEFFSSNIAVYRKPRYQCAVNRNLVIFSSGFAVNHIACMRFTVISGFFSSGIAVYSEIPITGICFFRLPFMMVIPVYQPIFTVWYGTDLTAVYQNNSIWLKTLYLTIEYKYIFYNDSACVLCNLNM